MTSARTVAGSPSPPLSATGVQGTDAGTTAAAASAVSTGAPKWSQRPPNMIEHVANHVQPMTSPPRTSVNQCTPRNTRVRRDRDRDRGGAAHEHRSDVVRTAPSDEQRERGVGGCCRGGVAGRERGAGEAGELVDGGSGPVDGPLHEVGDGELAGDDRGEERDDGCRPGAPRLDDGDDGGRGHDPERSAEQADRAHHRRAHRAGVAGPEVARRRSKRANPTLLRIISSTIPTATAPVVTATPAATRVTRAVRRGAASARRARASRGCLAIRRTMLAVAEVGRPQARPPPDGRRNRGAGGQSWRRGRR